MTKASTSTRAPRNSSARRTHRKGRSSSARKAALTRLYILRDITEDIQYDAMVACIVRARNATQARRLAQREGLDEIRTEDDDGLTDYNRTVSFWTDPQKTSCRRLSERGKEEMVMAETING